MPVQTIETGYTELDVVKTFMLNVDVVTSVRKLDSVTDYLDLLDLFYMDGTRRTGLLEKLLQQQDLGRYVIEVHGLKSSAASIGANRLSAIARQHEEAGKTCKTDWIIENSTVLAEQYQELLQEIRRVLSARSYGSFAVADTASLPAIGKEELQKRLGQALACLEDFESKEAVREVEELLSFALSEELRKNLEQVQSLLKVYEDDQAEELLRGLVGQDGNGNG